MIALAIDLMTKGDGLKLLFIINPFSGTNSTNWDLVITDYFKSSNHTIELYQLAKKSDVQTIKEKIRLFSPDQVVAVGGDGTIRLIATCLINQNIPLGILRAGSANGLAKELGISHDHIMALDVIDRGHSRKIHAIMINGQICIHLSDIGLNAYAMKKFKSKGRRGIWGYLEASLKALWQNPMIEAEIQSDKKVIKIKAEIIVIANATRYGSGAVINPMGKLDDHFFEVIAVKKISLTEIFKMIFSHTSFDMDKTEIFQTTSLSIITVKKVYFQIDGDYIGKVNEVDAILIPDAIQIIVPATGL